MSKQNICVITGSRAEFGLLYWLIKEIIENNKFQLQLIVTGMHLSTEFGNTYKEIEKEFTIDQKIDLDLTNDSPVGICRSMGIGISKFAIVFQDLQPDLIIVLGDRFEIFSAATAAQVCRIPVAHIHGGETTEGAMDESFRHSITKMSHLHFTSTEEYSKRVIQLGENPHNVFNVGAVGIDNILKLKLWSKNELEESLNFRFNKKNLLVTFHPVTLEYSTSKNQIKELLSALDTLKDTNFIFTKANSDTDGKVINQILDDYVSKNSHKSVIFPSLGQIRYLSCLQYIDGVVGNSSSGIIEVPTFKIGTINIGDRQKGRIQSESVINCEPYKEKILESIEVLYSSKFQNKLSTVKNPYGNGGSSKKIYGILSEMNFSNLLKKKFFDL